MQTGVDQHAFVTVQPRRFEPIGVGQQTDLYEDTFKLKALDAMKQTVDTLSGEVEKSKGYIARAEGQARAAQEARVENPLLSAIEG